jgi:N-acylneuraminate cytidylyltransferase
MNICLIPARKGSKRIKNKNIKYFFGRPLISYAIKVAKNSGLFDKVIVSTNCLKIKSISEKFGAEVPFIRPKKYSNGKATDTEVINHFLLLCKKQKIKLKYLCYMYPTNPLLTLKTLKNSFKILKNKRAQKVLTISKYEYPIQRALKKTSNGQIFFREPYYKNFTSQKLNTFYQDATQCYWYNLSKIKNFKKFEKLKTFGYELKNTEFVDLNNNDDLRKLKIFFKNPIT